MAALERSGLKADDIDFADQLDLVHSGSGSSLFRWGTLFIALCLGRELAGLSSWDAAVAFDAIEAFGVTGVRIDSVLRSNPVRQVRSPWACVADLAGEGIRMARGYGSAEHSTAFTHHSGDPLALRVETDGCPFNGSEVEIADASGVACLPGVEGEVLLRNPVQFLGYLSGDRSSFTDNGWFRTGDLGCLDSLGYLTNTGRLKEVIRRGENIAACEVENVVAGIPGVIEAAVVGVPDERFGERVHAFVVHAAAAPEIDLDCVREHFDRMGARFKIPEYLTEIGELPRDNLVKVKKQDLHAGGSV